MPAIHLREKCLVGGRGCCSRLAVIRSYLPAGIGQSLYFGVGRIAALRTVADSGSFSCRSTSAGVRRAVVCTPVLIQLLSNFDRCQQSVGEHVACMNVRESGMNVLLLA